MTSGEVSVEYGRVMRHAADIGAPAIKQHLHQRRAFWNADHPRIHIAPLCLRQDCRPNRYRMRVAPDQHPGRSGERGIATQRAPRTVRKILRLAKIGVLRLLPKAPGESGADHHRAAEAQRTGRALTTMVAHRARVRPEWRRRRSGRSTAQNVTAARARATAAPRRSRAGVRS